jgi:hypothetical protein
VAAAEERIGRDRRRNGEGGGDERGGEGVAPAPAGGNRVLPLPFAFVLLETEFLPLMCARQMPECRSHFNYVVGLSLTWVWMRGDVELEDIVAAVFG